MKLFLVATLLALATVSTAFADITILEEDDEPLDIPTDSPYMQTVVASAPDKLYSYTVLVQHPDDRKKVQEFVEVVVESRRRLSDEAPAQEVETFDNLDNLVAIRCTVAMANLLGGQEYVESVVMDLGMYASIHYNWGNDRSDQDALPTTRSYSPLATGKGQRVYIIDTGITTNHEEFEYGTRAVHGWNFVDNNGDVTDGHSHGTHCAGSAVGASIGMAPDATAVGVRVLNNNGGGSSTNVIRGVEWATADAKKHGVVGVLSLSLGGPADGNMDKAMSAAAAKGMIPVIAAGNAATNACNYSPARSTGGITVGATNKYDELAYFSNKGTCVDIFAPGRSIISASNQDPNTYRVKSGTSMAAPHVAGAVAVLLELLGGKSDLDTIMDLLESLAGRDYIKGKGRTLDGAPNLLLRVPAKGETFSGRATNAPTVTQHAQPSREPTKLPTTTPTNAPSMAPTVTDAVLTIDQASKSFMPSKIGPAFDPSRALNGYLVVDEGNANGCAATYSGDLTGSVALIRRGGCPFFDKVRHAQDRGAAGVVVYNHKTGDLVEMGHSGDQSMITIPSFFISMEDGQQGARDIQAGKPGHLYVGHPAKYAAPGAGRPDYGATPTPTKQPSNLITSAPTSSPTNGAGGDEPEPCETYKYYSHCMKITFPPRWTKCNWDHSTSSCKVRTAMPCSQHRLWKTCNIHGDVCQYSRGACKERPADKRKPLPTTGPQCMSRTTRNACLVDRNLCLWIEKPAYQRGCFSRGGGGILEAGGSPDEPYTPEGCNYGTYWQAHNYCEQNNMRLCSAEELSDDNGSTTNLSKQEANCDVATRHIWTNARCGLSSMRTYYEETDTARCQTVLGWRSRAGFRCCQDIPDAPF